MNDNLEGIEATKALSPKTPAKQFAYQPANLIPAPKEIATIEDGKNPEEKHSEEREDDIEFAHIIANALNELINEGVLTTERTSQASSAQLDEFVQRYSSSITKGLFTEKQKRKIRSRFGLEQIDSHYYEAGPIGSEVVTIAEKVLTDKKLRDAGIVGFILYGSRMDPNCKPREIPEKSMSFDPEDISDIDAIPVYDSSQCTMSNEEIYSLVKNAVKRTMPELQIPFSPSGIYTTAESEELRKLLRFPDWNVPYPIWGWNPETVQFTGYLPENPERKLEHPNLKIPKDEVTGMMRKALNSEQFCDAKKMLLADTKRFIKARYK